MNIYLVLTNNSGEWDKDMIGVVHSIMANSLHKAQSKLQDWIVDQERLDIHQAINHIDPYEVVDRNAFSWFVTGALESCLEIPTTMGHSNYYFLSSITYS